MKKVLFLFLFILAVSSCKKDENDIVSPNNRDYTPKIITENYGNSKLVGFVKDKSGNPLAGVTVFFGEEKALTKSDGTYQLNTLSAGSNKRIWFQKLGYASTQKLVDIAADLPNRIDASLFQIDKTEKMYNDGGLIEGKDFSVEIESGGFVFYDGTPVEEEVTAEITAFLTSEDEFLNAFPGDFRGIRENRSETAIESFGFIDVVLKVESGEPVQLAEGVSAIIKIKAPEKSPATIPMWHYDEDKAKWIEEGVGTLDKGLYTAEVSHFTKWNWDRPYDETSKIIGRVVDNAGNPIEGASVVQKGITYKFQNSAKTNEKGEFELLTPESNESKIEAQFEFFGSTIINYTTSPNKGQVNNIGDIKINVNIDNVMPPYVSDNVLYITIGQTARIRGNYFGQEKREDYKLLLNGNEVVTKTWTNDLIEFNAPNGIPEEGTIQIDINGILSREVNYIEGDWTCVIDNRIYKLNDDKRVDGLYVLALSRQNLNYIPDCICNLISLKKIYLNTNKLKTLPKLIGNLINLEYLSLSSNQISTLPESFGNLQNLESLWLYSNQISTLPENFGNLQNLQKLIINNNHLSTLPESFGNLQNLAKLDLSENPITKLPESFGNLQNLQELIIYVSKLTALPESFGNLQNLEELIIYVSKLTALPESFGNLQNLESLWLSRNQISTLPGSFVNLQNLKVLYLDSNQLRILPASVVKLQNLSHLKLSGNQLNTLPESIGQLKKLTFLDLVGNQLSSLPASIGNLQSLQELFLYDNQLTSLPESVKNLNGTLKYLALKGNKFSEEEKAKIKEWLPTTEITW